MSSDSSVGNRNDSGGSLDDSQPVSEEIFEETAAASNNGSLPSMANSHSSSSSDSSTATIQRQPSLQQRQCWVCFATDEDDPDTEWSRPCKCRGSTKWVHQKCLQRWVDEKQRGNTFAAVACGSCGYTYAIVYPRANLAVLVLEKLDRMIAKVCPMMTGGIIVISLYWTAVTYGAVTVMQLMGSERGLQTLEKTDPVILLLGLPTIPIALITFKMIRWEDKVVEWLRDLYVSPRSGSRRRLEIPAEGEAAVPPAAPIANEQAAQQQIIRDAASATRILCGALALPTIAVTVGKIVYGETVSPPLKRAFYGAAIFVVVRGATKIYYKYKQMIRQKNRRIIDYRPPTNSQEDAPSDAANGAQNPQAAAEPANNAPVPADLQP